MLTRLDGSTSFFSIFRQFVLSATNDFKATSILPDSSRVLTSSIGNGSDESASGILDIYSPSSTTYVKQFTAHFTVYRSTDEIWDCYIAGYMNTTSAVDAIQFTVDSGTFDGTIKLYGIS